MFIGLLYHYNLEHWPSFVENWVKISHHFATLDSCQGSQDGLACSLIEITFQNLTFNFAKSKNTPIMGGRWCLSGSSHASHTTLDTIWLFPALTTSALLYILDYCRRPSVQSLESFQNLLHNSIPAQAALGWSQQISRCKMVVKLWDFCHKA